MKPLSGYDSSALALLAQTSYLSEEDVDRILCSLQGDALEIAKVLAGRATAPAPEIQRSAEGFLKWAAQVGRPQ